MTVEIVISIAGLVVVVYGAIIYDFYQKLDRKQDLSLCQEIKRGINADLARGDKRFDKLIEEIQENSRCLTQISENLALTIQRLQGLENRLPVLERRQEARL